MTTLPQTGDILVVDDTPANLRLLAGMLTEQGYKARSAPNGKLALMAARSSPPDLILLDITMPDLNGYQVCEHLKADPRTRDIPVIFISALDQTEDKVKAFTLGGMDYITKPFQLEEVLARVRTHLTLHNLRRQLEVANQDLLAANARLAQTNAELENSNAELDAFAHTVAHDLKTPLSVVVGFSSLLEARWQRMEPAKVLEDLQRITATGYKMRDIVDELLLLASIRQNEAVELAPLDMGAIVDEALKRFEPQVQAQGVTVVLPQEWPVVRGYAAWVEEVWANYISNALKYGGRPPRIALHWEPVATEAGRIRFEVQDNGPGLSAEEQAKVFVPFTRLHHFRADGNGLGLSIVQRIVTRLGGAVGVESEPGQGCRFWFSLRE